MLFLMRQLTLGLLIISLSFGLVYSVHSEVSPLEFDLELVSLTLECIDAEDKGSLPDSAMIQAQAPKASKTLSGQTNPYAASQAHPAYWPHAPPVNFNESPSKNLSELFA